MQTDYANPASIFMESAATSYGIPAPCSPPSWGINLIWFPPLGTLLVNQHAPLFCHYRPGLDPKA